MKHFKLTTWLLPLITVIFGVSFLFAVHASAKPLVDPDPGMDEYTQPPASSYGIPQAQQDDQKEVYVWDGNDLILKGGALSKEVYEKGIRLKLEDGSYRLDGPMDVIDFSGYEGKNCPDIPADQTKNLRFYADQNGGVRLDLLGDGSDNGVDNAGSGEIKFGKDVGNGTFLGGSGFSNSKECEYMLYQHFRYRTDAANILGKKGQAYDQYVKEQDRKNIYRAYRASMLDKAIKYCQSDKNKAKPDTDSCLVSIVNAFDKCYSEVIGNKQVKDADMNPNDLLTCMRRQADLLKYFGSPDDIEEFVRDFINNTAIPPSVGLKLDPPTDKPGSSEAKTTCAIEKIGWILCPVFTFVAKISDQLFQILQNWLVIRPFEQKMNSQYAPAYQVWLKLLGIANVMFVIVLIIIIYSLVTGGGMSAYNIRKLLPRLIVAAILVNVSYYLCAIAVDLSNIVGDSIYKIMRGGDIYGSANVASGSANFSNWEAATTSIVLAGGALAGTVAIVANLAALVPIMLAALFAMLITVIILVLRQAFIIILVVISPIAFVMYLLPNTQKWFNKWKDLFIQMLVLYPIISLIFGGSYFASLVIRQTAAQNGDTLLTIFSLGVQVIPLFITPLLIKFGGQLIHRFGGIVNNKSKGPYDRLQKRAGEFKDDRNALKQTRAAGGAAGAFGIGALRRRAMRNAYKKSYRSAQLKDAMTKGAGANSKSIARGSVGTFGGREAKDLIEAMLAKEAQSLEGKKLNAALTKIDKVFLSSTALSQIGKSYNDALEEMAQDGTFGGKKLSEEDRAAAISKLASQGELTQIHALIDKANSATGSLGKLEREALVKGIQQSGIAGSAVHLGGSALESIRTGTVQNVGQLYADAASKGKYTEAAIATQGSQAIDGLVAAKNLLKPGDLANIRRGLSNVKNSPENGELRTRMTTASENAWSRL